MKLRLAALAFTAALALAAPARAQILCGGLLPGLLPMTLTATNLSFGDYRATDASPVTATGTITASCPLGLNLLADFTISLSAGASGSFAARTMTSGANELEYNLYTAADHVTVWGDGTGGSATVLHTGTVTFGGTPFTVYGRLPAGQWSAAGSYSDTIIVTVSF